MQSIAFKLFIFFIRNPYVPDEPPERKLKRLQLSATSLIGFGALGKMFFMFAKGYSHRNELERFWDDAFRWMKILVDLHRDGTFAETETVHAACASMFLVLADLNRKYILRDDLKVFVLAFRLWMDDAPADDGEMGDASIPLGVLCSQMELNLENEHFLDKVVEVCEEIGFKGAREGQLARRAIRRLNAELKRVPPRERALSFHLDILWPFTKDEDQYENRATLASEGLPSIISALAHLATADVPVWTFLTDTMTRAIELLNAHLCTNKSDDADRMLALLRCRPGLLTMMRYLSDRFDWLDDGKPAALGIVERLLELSSVPTVRAAVLEELESLPAESDTTAETESDPDDSTIPLGDTTLQERLQALRTTVTK